MKETITSIANPRIKALAALRRKGRSADERRILIDGRREIERAVESGTNVEELYYCAALLESDDDFPRKTAARGIRLVETTEPVFDKIRYGDRTGGLLAVAVRPNRKLADLRLPDAPVVCIVEHVDKPGNLGGILRSADGAGIDAVLFADLATDLYGPNVIRASLGTIFTIPVVQTPVGEVRSWIEQRHYQIVAATPAATAVYTEVDFTRPTALVLGSEARGLSDAWPDAEVTRVRIPMHGRADSLNVSVTAAILFYEARRQRDAREP